MQTEDIDIGKLGQLPNNTCSIKIVFPNEVEDVDIELITLKRSREIKENPTMKYYDVLYVLDGSGMVEIKQSKYTLKTGTIIRIPINSHYSIYSEDYGIHFLRIRKVLNRADLAVISKNQKEHSVAFVCDLKDCPTYTEDIKSSKSINRMILPNGKVPRFCMGSVETEGPDIVAEHEHPMLDQLFLGLKDCRCTCTADGEKEVLTENMLLHIPLGSKHSVCVAKGDKLAYVWFDFFLTLEGQRYMDEQHQLEDQ